eukprot:m.40764 g.40764  ORF g.40764 m.40764 type:complete len:338 (-) comp14853_c0_seq1:126-1139(-)
MIMQEQLIGLVTCALAFSYAQNFGGLPVGAIIPYASETVPENFLSCNGSVYIQSEYPDLYQVIGRRYIAAGVDHESVFRVPDCRGYFIRGWDNGSGNDPDAASRSPTGNGTAGDVVGTTQRWTLVDHSHATSISIRSQHAFDNPSSSNGYHVIRYGENRYLYTLAVRSVTGLSRDDLSSEVRPKNIAFHYIIRSKPDTSGDGDDQTLASLVDRVSATERSINRSNDALGNLSALEATVAALAASVETARSNNEPQDSSGSDTTLPLVLAGCAIALAGAAIGAMVVVTRRGSRDTVNQGAHQRPTTFENRIYASIDADRTQTSATTSQDEAGYLNVQG